MSWAKKIMVLYLCFVALILTLAFKCFGHKSELEYNDYYARELKFQQQIDALQNANRLNAPITHEVSGNKVLIRLPQQLLSDDLEGRIELLRPSDSSLDIHLELSVDESGFQSISIAKKGLYRLRIYLQSQGINYFHEGIINIQ